MTSARTLLCIAQQHFAGFIRFCSQNMLDSDQAFDSLRGKLTTILLGTLTFGAVVPTILDYLQAVLYYSVDKHPAADFQWVCTIYFLLPASCIAFVWPLILKSDGAEHLLPFQQKIWVRWGPPVVLLGLSSLVYLIIIDFNQLPTSLCLIAYCELLVGSALTAFWLMHRVNRRISRVSSRRFRPVLLSWRYRLSVASIPTVLTTVCLLIGLITFKRAEKALHTSAVRFANKSDQDTIKKNNLLLWVMPDAKDEQLPFLARRNLNEVKATLGKQDSILQRLRLRTVSLPTEPTAELTRIQGAATLSAALKTIVILDSCRGAYQPLQVKKTLAAAQQSLRRLATDTTMKMRTRLVAHELAVVALSLARPGLERQAQEYYSLLLGQLQFKGRMWLAVLLCMLSWGWAVLRVVDEGYRREVKTKYVREPTSLPFQEEQALLQQFAFIVFGLLIPLMRPVKPESIALDKPLWSLTLPAFVRETFEPPSAIMKPISVVYADNSQNSSSSTYNRNISPIDLEGLKQYIDQHFPVEPDEKPVP